MIQKDRINDDSLLNYKIISILYNKNYISVYYWYYLQQKVFVKFSKSNKANTIHLPKSLLLPTNFLELMNFLLSNLRTYLICRSIYIWFYKWESKLLITIVY